MFPVLSLHYLCTCVQVCQVYARMQEEVKIELAQGKVSQQLLSPGKLPVLITCLL